MGEQPRSFDPHEPIDLADDERVAALSKKLGATMEELAEAVEKVGPLPTAVAIFLGCPDAV